MLALSFIIAGKLNSSFTGTFKKANDKVKDTSKSLAKMQQELTSYERLQKQGLKEVEKSTKAHEKLKIQYSQSVQALLQLNKKYQDTKNELKTLIDQKKKGTISVEEFENAQAKLKNQLKESGTAYNELKLKTQATRGEMQRLAEAEHQGKLKAEANAKAHAELAKQLEKAEQKQKRLADLTEKQQRLSDLQGKVKGFSQNSLATGMKVGASLTVPVYASVKFESAMADVKKVVDFDTPQQFKEMSKDILDLSKRIPIVADGLAAIVAAGGQSGIAREDLTQFAEDAAKMGVAFDVSADDAGQLMAEWRTAFKLNQKEVVELADKVNLLGNTTAASAPKISEVVQRIGPLGEIGGLVSGEIAALGASIVGAGVAPEIASTGIKNMILSLTKGEAATKSQKLAFKALGLDAKKMAKTMQKDAQGGILSVLSAIQKLPQEKQTSIMNQLFGSESIGAIAPLLTNLDELKNNFNKVGDAAQYAGSMQAEFDARADTKENKLILLKNSAMALGITLGDTFLPYLSQGAEWLAKVTSKVQEFSDKHPVLTRNLMIGVAGFVGLAIAAGGLGLIVSNVIIPIGQAVLWMKKVEVATKLWTVAQKALNLVIRMNPIMRIVMLIMALVGAGYWLAKNWDTVREKTGQLWEKLGAFKGVAAIVLGPLGQIIRTAVTMAENWDSTKSIWENVWNGIKLAAQNGVNDVIGSLNSLIEKVNKILGVNVPLIARVEWVEKGNKAAASTGGLKQIERYAKGGILTRPHIGMVAEEGPEAVIPLNGTQRAYSLWVRAGQLLGVQPKNGQQTKLSSSFSRLKEAKEQLSSTSTQGVVYNIEYAPNLSGTQNTSEIKQILQQDKRSFFEQLKQIEHDRERLRFT